MNAPKIVRPRDLREALGVAFVHRGRINWRAGTSRFLGMEYPGSGDGAVTVDVTGIADFHDVRADRYGLRIGAFAALDVIAGERAVRDALGADSSSAGVARFRLNALGAQLVIAGMGQTRTAPLAETLGANGGRPLAAGELPVAVELRADGPRVCFGDRRIRRRDGEATFELRVFVGLTFAGVHRIASAAIAYSLDGAAPMPLGAVEAMLRGSMIAKSTFADAARQAGDAFRGDNVHANTLRRTIVPLVLSALKDAYASARART